MKHADVRMPGSACALLFSLVLILSLAACGRGDNVTVHIVGYSDDGQDIDAFYWKGGVKTIALDTASPSNANFTSICCAGTNMYIGGQAWHDGRAIATYWKNGEAFALSDGAVDEYVEAVCVSGDTLYAAGWKRQNEKNSAKYWKADGDTVEAFDLSDGTRLSAAFAIAVSGKDVYIGGIEYAGDNTVAKYWKNTARTAYTLGDGSRSSGVHALLVHNGDVYAAGWESKNSRDAAKYWINNASTARELGDGRSVSRITALAAYGNDVYAVGYEGVRSRPAARYWINDTPFFLTSGKNDACAKAICVIERDGERSVYIAGFDSDGQREHACFWRIDATGLQSVTLSDGSKTTKANAIVVTDSSFSVAQ
jgi:hypothetical protein